MKPKSFCTAWFVLLAGMLCPVMAQNTSSPPASTDGARTNPSEARTVGRTTAPALGVTVTAEAWTGDFVSYTSGGNFVVIVPQAKTDAIKWSLAGQGLMGVQVEQRGEDVVVTLRVDSATRPRVHQQGNRFDILFGTVGTVPAGNVATTEGKDVTRVDASPAVVNNNTAATPVNPVPASTSTPAAASSNPAAVMPTQPSVVSRSRTLGAAPVQSVADLALPLITNNATADSLNLNLTTPESPAFAVLGFTPQTVLRPATPQQFGTSLINGLDQNGNFQNGLAIDTAPYMLINGENVTIKDYMDQYVTRLLSRTQFSFAVTKGATTDDLTTRLAAGINFTLWDRGDPRIYRPGQEGDVLSCFVRVLDFDKPIPPTIDPDDRQAIDNFVGNELQRLKQLADDCRAEGAKARWNRSAWTIAYAPSWISKTGQSSDFKWNGGAFWTSLAYGFERFPSLRKMSQLIVHARYRTREQVVDDANPGQFLTQNTFFFGARFRAGSPKFALNFEDGFARTKTLGGGIDTSNKFSIGTELRLADNLYFVISAGGNAARADGQSKGFVLTSFKYGFNKQPQVNIR